MAEEGIAYAAVEVGVLRGVYGTCSSQNTDRSAFRIQNRGLSSRTLTGIALCKISSCEQPECLVLIGHARNILEV